jgi:enterochelin esterase-like enzyme
MRLILTFFLLAQLGFAAEPDFPLTADSKAQPEVPKGTMIKDTYTAKEGSVFPGTQREYQIYLPAGLDQSKPAAFMVFQDGVIYQAPVVFDNLFAKKDIPLFIGLFIKPGIVPAANGKALPRFNRSYEYDSITPTYSKFLIDEFLPAIEAKHGVKLSTDPNHAAISGNSSGGICAFMTAWHRPDRFRRVFTGVGTYVGIHGADQLPVLVRKFEPKPLRVFLQSGTGDNNLYCGDWWMANQMMERSLAWAGYDVNHAWGEGGHNQKHASQIFPEVLRWLWRDWQTDIEVKANPKGESKWKGYEVVGEGDWEEVPIANRKGGIQKLASNSRGDVLWVDWDPTGEKALLVKLPLKGAQSVFASMDSIYGVHDVVFGKKDSVYVLVSNKSSNDQVVRIDPNGMKTVLKAAETNDALLEHFGSVVGLARTGGIATPSPSESPWNSWSKGAFAMSPDQSSVYHINGAINSNVDVVQNRADGSFAHEQSFHQLQPDWHGIIMGSGMCVDTKGWLYVATALGIQVCDQAGRVNFIIPTPKQPYDVCFGGKDLSELFIACDDTIYKRPTKAKGVVSGQQAPIKPPAPKL